MKEQTFEQQKRLEEQAKFRQLQEAMRAQHGGYYAAAIDNGAVTTSGLANAIVSDNSAVIGNLSAQVQRLSKDNHDLVERLREANRLATKLIAGCSLVEARITEGALTDPTLEEAMLLLQSARRQLTNAASDETPF